MNNDSELIYSTNPELNKKCPRCKKLKNSCVCNKSQIIDVSKIRPLLRIEKKHRGGKEVTVIERLPPSDEFLKNMAGALKKRCGSGGTFKVVDGNGIIEIQGDRRLQIKSELAKQGIQCR